MRTPTLTVLLLAFAFTLAGCSYYKNTTFEERQKRRKEVIGTAQEAAKTGDRYP